MTEYDWSGRVPASHVVDAVAAEAGSDPEALEPLARTVDPDALNALFDPPAMGTTRHRRVAFRYAGYEVTVRGDGRIELEELEGLEG